MSERGSGGGIEKENGCKRGQGEEGVDLKTSNSPPGSQILPES